MQGQKSTSKGTFIGIIAVVLISMALFFYFKGKPDENSISSLETLSSLESGEAKIASDRIVKLLNETSALRIDESIFKSAVYKSLIDYTVAIPEQNIGKVNPFAPF